MQRLRTRLRAGASTFPSATFALNFLTGGLDPAVTFTRSTTATFVGSNGLIQSAAINTPRFDYDPVTLAAKGLLIEEQRTNLALYSEQFDNAAWAKAKITATVDAIASPSGSSNADKISSNISSAGGYLVSQNPSVTSGTAYTASAYLKKAELGFAFLFVTGGTPTTSVSINLTTGAATTGTGSPLNVSSVDAGNGWWRVSFNVVATLSTLGGIAVYLSNDGVWANRNDAIAVNSGIYLWGAQLEAGAFATSYIPTVASQVTRSADVATMTGTNFSSWYNQTEGTFVAEADTVGTSTRSVVMVGADDNNRVQIAHTGSTDALFRIVNAGVAANPANIAATKTGFKAALAYKQSDAAASVGASAVTTSSPTSMVAHTAAYLGSNAAAGLFLNGHIRQIAYYNTRLPNATLQALTV